MSAEYVGWACQLGLASNSPVLPCQSISNPPNITTTTDESGTTTTQTRSVMSVAPQLLFTTKAVDRALAVIPQAGTCIVNPSGTLRSVTAFYKRVATCKDFTVASDDHASRAMLAGGVFPLTLSAGSRGESLKLSFEVNGLNDGTNGSLVLEDEATLPVFAAADKYEYVMAKARIGGVVMDMTSFNLNFGITQVERRMGLGSLEPETAGTRRVEPVIEVSGLDMRNFDAATIPLAGKAAAHTDTEFWFVRRASGSGLVAAGTAAHMKISMSGMVICTEGGSASGNNSATTSFRVESIDDGTNAPLIFTFAAAYSPGF